jgi:hypothetical protein
LFSLYSSVIDDYQLDRHFTQRDIKELYSFQLEQLPEAQSTSNRKSNYPEPEDRLLLDLLDEHSRWIHSYHCHDSLLENKIDESLTAEERRQGKFFILSSFFSFYIHYSHRKIALEEYENLKRLPIQRFPSQQANNTGNYKCIFFIYRLDNKYNKTDSNDSIFIFCVHSENRFNVDFIIVDEILLYFHH